jgi:hypothetical protein
MGCMWSGPGGPVVAEGQPAEEALYKTRVEVMLQGRR